MSNQNKFYPLAHIVCHDQNRVIGDGNNDLPWRCKEDMDYFKKVTTHKVVIMGFNTYKSIPNVAGSIHDPVLHKRIGIVIANPERFDYDPASLCQINRLIENYRGGDIDSLKGFTVYVPDLDSAITACKIIHEALSVYAEQLPSWIKGKEEVGAYIIGGGKLYLESLHNAYIREIHETVLPVMYVPTDYSNRDALVTYPELTGVAYRVSQRSVHLCKVKFANGKVTNGRMSILLLRKTIGLDIFNS